MPIPTRLIRLAAIAPLLLFLAAAPSPGADASPRKAVLIIESFGQRSATAVAVAFRTTLEREVGSPVDVYHVSLDAARFPGADHEAELSDFLKLRYQGRKIDLVATMQAPAAQFVARQRERLFADTPVVITGVEPRRVPPGLHTATTTYVGGEIDLPGRIENILQLLPDTRRIVMIHGASAYDQFWAKQNRRELERFSGRVEIVWLEGRSFEKMREQVAGLPPGSVVYLGLIVLDADGIPVEREESLESLRAVSKVPIFGYLESYVGKGIVGGRLYADVSIGTEAARVAIRILNGEAQGPVPPVILKETRPIYDWRELHRFGIDEDRLPSGRDVRYRQQTVWEAYRWHIAATIALLILQAALIVGLVLQRARKRRAEAELLHTRGELAHMTRVFTLGELSASLAHELNQPLTAILSNVQAAQRFMKAGGPANIQEVCEILADVAQDNKRAGEIIRRMRSMVKKKDLDAAPLDMAGVVHEVVELLHSDAVLRHVSVSLEAEPGLPAALGDRVQLQQVVLNLLINAFDAMKESHVSERTVLVRVGREDEHMLKVTVTDVGHGLPEDSTDRLFAAFYTTKSNGLGMGLSISRSIVEAHRGRLWAVKNLSRGATFCFTVPLAAG